MKKLIFAVALASFGTLAMAQQVPANKENKRLEKQERHLEKMQKDLGLNDAQVAKIKDLRNREMMQNKSEGQNLKSGRKARMESRDAEMKNILSTEQYGKWKAEREEKKAEIKEKMKNRGKIMQSTTN